MGSFYRKQRRVYNWQLGDIASVSRGHIDVENENLMPTSILLEDKMGSNPIRGMVP
jgi:hypothetical protein